MLIPAISDISFCKVLDTDIDPEIIPFETTPRIFAPRAQFEPVLTQDCIAWIKDSWKKTVKLMIANPKFYSAFKAFDSSSTKGRLSSSLLSIWRAIKQLFSSNSQELKYMVSSNLAAYLSEPGEKRYALFKEISKLYNDRSTAAHTSKDIEHGPLAASFAHLRNALIKMIEAEKFQHRKNLKKLVFQGN